MKKEKNYIPSKFIYILFFLIPIVILIATFKSLDNDIWYLLSEGKYILTNGIYHIDPLSMHTGLQVTVQNWLSASIFYTVFKFFGEYGLFFLVILCNFFICFLLYKICNLISDKNRLLSLIIMLITDVSLCAHYIVIRPQILSFILLLGVIYVLELYAKTENYKYLIWLPILSIIEINMHASLWLMIFLFTLPYIIDSIKKFPIIKTQGYKAKPLLLFTAIALLTGLLNPYGIKAITFIFTSFSDYYMHIYIQELQGLRILSSLGINVLSIIISTISLYILFFKQPKRLRYFCLFAGTLLLGLMSLKGCSHFILVSLFPLSYLLKDVFPRNISFKNKTIKNIITISIVILNVTLLSLGVYSFLNIKSDIPLRHDGKTTIDALDVQSNKNANAKVYSSFNNGGYVEFRGYKPYIDPRAEVFLKINNKKKDIFKEYYMLQHEKLNYKKFLKTYDFDYLFIQSVDNMFAKINEEDGYILTFQSKDGEYRLYTKTSLLSKKDIKKYKEKYKNLETIIYNF